MTTILLDYDGARPRDFSERMRVIESYLGFRFRSFAWTRSRRGWHVRMRTAEKLQPLEVVLVQALMGSDWRREVFNFVRARNLARAPGFWRQEGRWNVLYARKL